MMARNALPRPTDGELAILRVLWVDGPGTVRDIHGKLQGDRTVGYTTVLKLLQIMTDKGLVRRDESERTHVYRAAASEDHTQQQLVRDLLDRAFGGSAQKLILQALSARKASRDELDQIRKLLDELKGGSK
jgi:BlaI family transcriptional regulator, penicillinase repressor